MMELVDESERAIAQLAACLFIECVDVAAGDVHDAGGRPIEAAEDLQQRRLAGPGRANNSDTFARPNAEVYALQHLQVDGSLAKGTHDATGFEHRLGDDALTHVEAPQQAACAKRATPGR